jgi:hypothetical protein
MVRNLTTSGDPNVGPFAPRSLTRFFAANIARRIGRIVTSFHPSTE